MAKSQDRREHSSALISASALLRAVFDRSGNVIGYEPVVTEPSAHYVLMPDRRERSARATTDEYSIRATPKAAEAHRLAAQRKLLATPTAPPVRSVQQPARPVQRTGTFAYTLRDKRARPDGLTRARQDAYIALLKAKAPMTVREVATVAKHPVETTQQLVKWLVDHKLARREAR
jgi:hypothetical protein